MRFICSKSLTSRALTAFSPFTHSCRKSTGRPLKSGTSATSSLPCFFHPVIFMPPLMTASLPTSFSPLSSGRNRKGSYKKYVPAPRLIVTSVDFPSRLISRALRMASVSDESGVMLISAACKPMVHSRLTKRSIFFIGYSLCTSFSVISGGVARETCRRCRDCPRRNKG